jgi:hypothetical protein
MQAKHSNILVVGHETLDLNEATIRGAMVRLQQRVERDEFRTIQRYGYRDRADFFRSFRRLSEVVLHGMKQQGEGRLVGWINPQANERLAAKVRTALYRGLRAES